MLRDRIETVRLCRQFLTLAAKRYPLLIPPAAVTKANVEGLMVILLSRTLHGGQGLQHITLPTGPANPLLRSFFPGEWLSY